MSKKSDLATPEKTLDLKGVVQDVLISGTFVKHEMLSWDKDKNDKAEELLEYLDEEKMSIITTIVADAIITQIIENNQLNKKEDE